MTLQGLATPTQVGFTHAGAYADPEGRPIIEVEFAATSREGRLLGSTQTGVLIDSGAPMTLLGYIDSIRLGLDLGDPHYPRDRIGGIVPGFKLPVAYAVIKVFLCGRWLNIPAAFSTSPVEVRNVLGRDGVFDRILFAFQHGTRSVLARP